MNMWQGILAFVAGALLAGLVAWQMALRWARRRHQKERLLIRRTRRAEKLAELGSLTGGLAHEIRNPLSAIKMNLQLLAEDIAHQRDQAKTATENPPPLDDPQHLYQRQGHH